MGDCTSCAGRHLQPVPLVQSQKPQHVHPFRRQGTAKIDKAFVVEYPLEQELAASVLRAASRDNVSQMDPLSPKHLYQSEALSMASERGQASDPVDLSSTALVILAAAESEKDSEMDGQDENHDLNDDYDSIKPRLRTMKLVREYNERVMCDADPDMSSMWTSRNRESVAALVARADIAQH